MALWGGSNPLKEPELFSVENMHHFFSGSNLPFRNRAVCLLPLSLDLTRSIFPDDPNPNRPGKARQNVPETP
jgi:hypothetical protein